MVASLSSKHTQAEVDSTHPDKKSRMIHEYNSSRGRRHSRPNASHIHHENDDMAVTNDNILQHVGHQCIECLPYVDGNQSRLGGHGTGTGISCSE